MDEPVVVLAFVVAEFVKFYPGMKQYVITATFDYFYAPKFPIEKRFYAYVCLTDGRGELPMALKLIRASDEFELLTVPGRVVFADPVEVQQAHVELLAKFPEAGEYRLQLYVGGQFLVERRITVLPIKQ